MHQDNFLIKPALMLPHLEDHTFIGQSIVRLKDDSLLMLVPSGLSPADFEGSEVIPKMPRALRSKDNGRTWLDEGEINVEWNAPGIPCGGGINFLCLDNGVLLLVMHHRVKGRYGGGVPVITRSPDNGRTWTPVKTLIPDDGEVYYVMNDSLVMLRSGRMIIPAAARSLTMKDYFEGGICDACCFYSDDSGESWQLTPVDNRVILPDDPRGMAEPGIAELSDGSIIMLARTGKGCLYSSYSTDAGMTWRRPEPTSLICPCSSFTLRRMNDGRLIVFYNHAEPMKAGAFFPRNPLSYAISADDGKSWSEPAMIDNEGCELDGDHRQHIYPSVCFTSEGLLLAYTTHPAPPDGVFRTFPGRKPGGVKVALLAI